MISSIPVLAISYAIFAFIFIQAWKRHEIESTSDLLSSFITTVDKRSLSSGNFASPSQRRRKIGYHVRSVSWRLFIPSIEVLFYSVVYGSILFIGAVFTHLMIDLISGYRLEISDLADRARVLLLGLLETTTFGLSFLTGMEADVISDTAWKKVVSLVFVGGMVVILVETLLQVLRNFLALCVSVLFPYSVYRAADRDFAIEENSHFERVLFRLMGYASLTERRSWLERLF